MDITDSMSPKQKDAYDFIASAYNLINDNNGISLVATDIDVYVSNIVDKCFELNRLSTLLKSDLNKHRIVVYDFRDAVYNSPFTSRLSLAIMEMIYVDVLLMSTHDMVVDEITTEYVNSRIHVKYIYDTIMNTEDLGIDVIPISILDIDDALEELSKYIRNVLINMVENNIDGSGLFYIGFKNSLAHFITVNI